jgi:hypothetical protein
LAEAVSSQDLKEGLDAASHKRLPVFFGD